jgi:maltose/moltooligosaccharide transporter
VSEKSAGNSGLPAIDVDKPFRCGTLTYTKMGVTALFAWLLWGDFCFTVMEAVGPSVLPLKLKSLGCSNWLIGLVLSTLPNILSMTVCPVVSVKSDRYRGKWGRRLPFIVWTMPFLCLSLMLIGWTDDISAFFFAHSAFLQQYTPATISIALIAIFIAMFSFFNMFVGSVFYYLFNDVVPPQFIARFTGAFRIVGTVAGAFYNFFIFQYAESHMREIFVGSAILYFVGFGLMSLRVKEGEYPPVEEDHSAKKPGKLAELSHFFKECFTHKIYWMIFLFTTIGAGRMAINPFWVFFSKEMGLPLIDIGKLGAITGLMSIGAMYVSSIYIDRWHPLRVTVYMTLFSIVGALTGIVWVFVTLPGNYFFWLSLASGTIETFFGALGAASSMPLFMRMFPQSRFGQFCSAQSILRSFLCLGASVAAGLFIDGIKYFCNGTDFAYRFIFVWQLLGNMACCAVIVIAYREWYRLGGDEHYHPPATWDPKGYEEMQGVKTQGPQSRWIVTALRLFDAVVSLSLVCIPLLMIWMAHSRKMAAFSWHAYVMLPLSLIAWIYWRYIRTGIVKDLDRARNGEAVINGIPHHGVLIVNGLLYLISQVFWIVQVGMALKLGMETGAIAFTGSNVLTNFLLIATVQGICRIERGFSVRLDEASA